MRQAMTHKRLFLLHTSATLVPVFQQLCSAKLKNVDVFNIADDSLIKDVITRGELTPTTSSRVLGHLESAQQGGADMILVTCSSIGPAVDAATPMIDVPVLRVDQPMAARAVATGRRVGVVGRLPTTLKPTAELIRRRAAAAGKQVELTERLCEGAFDALMSGDSKRHDEMVSTALQDLAKKVDVIVLAQASMARVVEGLPPEARRTPILASPPLAIDFLAEQFASENARV
jgi:Asp/Glu/hydantoin racemase